MGISAARDSEFVEAFAAHAVDSVGNLAATVEDSAAFEKVCGFIPKIEKAARETARELEAKKLDPEALMSHANAALELFTFDTVQKLEGAASARFRRVAQVAKAASPSWTSKLGGKIENAMKNETARAVFSNALTFLGAWGMLESTVSLIASTKKAHSAAGSDTQNGTPEAGTPEIQKSSSPTLKHDLTKLALSSGVAASGLLMAAATHKHAGPGL